MNVLVTGGAGYIGSITTRLLLDHGHSVTVFDNLEIGHLEAIDPRCRFIEGDLRNPGDIDMALQQTRPEAIIHFAAYALVGESMDYPELYWENNVSGGINLVNAAVRYRVGRFIFSSSCATYGTPDQLPITENTPQRPENPYGESKLMVENILRWTQEKHGLSAVCLRYFNACGAADRLGEDHAVETHLIPNVLNTALGLNKQLNILGTDFPTPDGTCIRDYVHVKDLAQAHLLALESEVSGAFNLGTGRGYSVHEIIEAARTVTGLEIRTRECERRPGDPAALVASAEKAKQELGWEPIHSDLENIMRDAWNWHKSNPRGYATPSRRKGLQPCVS
jgi:UDP-glucose 4-epimerase